MTPFELPKTMLRPEVFRQLARDLRKPPDNFPKFDMNVLFYIDDQGEIYGDMCAFVMARALGNVGDLTKFVRDGGNLAQAAMTRMGANALLFSQLIYPADLLYMDYPMHTVTHVEAADLVQSFIDSGYKLPDLEPLLTSIYTFTHDDDTPESIPDRVDRWLAKYGGRA